jgi:hypothetical protein
MIKISILLLVSYVLFAQSLPVKNQDVSPQQLQKQNTEIAKLVATELSKDLPKIVDKFTKFTKIEAIDANLIYTFEINAGAKSDESIIKNDKKRMEKGVTSGICKSSKRFMDALITITYIYRSAATGSKLFQFDIDQQKCYKLYGIK